MWRIVVTLLCGAFGAAGMALALGDLVLGAGVGAAIGIALGFAVSSLPVFGEEVPIDVVDSDDNGDGENNNTPPPFQM